MPKRKSPKDFFQKARDKGSESNKDIVNGDEIRKKLQPKTEKNYARALELWHQYEIEHTGAIPYDIETSKDFVRSVAFGIEGSYEDPKACLSSVIQYYKDFTAGWQWDRRPQISSRVTLSTSNFIKGPLKEELDLPYRKRVRRYGTMIHFIHLGTQLWQKDWLIYEKPGIRLDVWGEIQMHVFTSSRVGEFIESTCRRGTGRGLYYRDITFGVFQNEHGKAEFAMQVVRDAKNMTFTPDKRPEHSLHEGLKPRPLFCNPILTYLAIFIANDAFRDYKTVDELFDIKPLEEEMYQLQWNPSMLDMPFFQGRTGKIDTADTFSRRLRQLGSRAGYIVPPTTHDFRAEGLHLIDKLYSSAQRMKHGGHKDENTHRDHYAPNNAGTDGQGSYFNDELRSIVSDRFRAMTLYRNPELWQSLPAEKQDELEHSSEFVAIEDELEVLSRNSKDDSTTRDRRKELRADKRKLLTEELRKCQKLQPNKLPSSTDENGMMGYHRTRFSRTCGLMPERDRLASSLFTVAPIRSDEGRAVLRDMITLYRQDTEVASRPGLEPEKCGCSETGRKWKIDSKPTAGRWRHIYTCHKKRLVASQGFAELCFICSEWIVDKGRWKDHCQAHLDNPETLPAQCNPFNYGGTLASPGTCPFCLGDTALPATVRMYQFLDRAGWREHVYGHHGCLEATKLPKCPHPRSQCADAFVSAQELKFHLQDVHCVEFIKGSKKSRPADEDSDELQKCKRAKDTNKDDVNVEFEECSEQKIKFVDEAAKFGSHEISTTSSTSPSTAPSTASTVTSTGPSTPASIDLTQVTDWIVDGTTYTLESPTYFDIIDKIDPRLLPQPVIHLVI